MADSDGNFRILLGELLGLEFYWTCFYCLDDPVLLVCGTFYAAIYCSYTYCCKLSFALEEELRMTWLFTFLRSS